MTVDLVSIDNMKRQAANFNRMQKRLLWLYMQGFVGTADEAGERIGLSPLQVRPRCTKLIQLGMLEKAYLKTTGRNSSSWVLRLRRGGKQQPELPL